MGIKERLLLYLDNQGITKYAFYKKTNLGNGYLDKTNEPHIDKIEKILLCYENLNREWLINGKGEMLIDVSNIVSEPQEPYGKNFKPDPKPNTLKTKGVPIYNVEFNAGLLPLSTEYVHFEEFIIGYCDFPEVQGADLITKMRGNSMTGVLENGDWISFRKLNSLSVINYGHIFGIITNDKVPLIKYVRKGPTDDILILKSHNPAFDDIELPKSEILAMFMVIDKVQITALAN